MSCYGRSRPSGTNVIMKFGLQRGLRDNINKLFAKKHKLICVHN